ncbi:MAG: 3-phosphoshikimate 1-carboxyvinyltransferase [Acidobacteriia bacterium]|nr:3-phosphoshikimate 1-carboxyvinyltransferase [Terriglobia bacterium]
MKNENPVIVRPARNIRGSVAPPGDKSISHRYAMLGAIARGQTRLKNFSSGADCASTLACMAALGAGIERGAEGAVEINGGALREPRQALDCGNSGSTMRMLSGILAGQDFTSEMVGDESLSRRPMRRVIEPLQRMGARIDSRDGCAPLRIHGGGLHAIEYQVPVASAQVKSAVLLAGLFAEGETWVEEPLPTRDHTEVALEAFGAKLRRAENRAAITGGQQLKAIEAEVPGDVSSAAFFLCAAALFPESELIVERALLNPTRTAVIDVLNLLGLRTLLLDAEDRHGELSGTIRALGGRLRGTIIDGADTAALIDELPVLAAIGPYTEDGIEIRDARELRVKESDRIAAVASNLRTMGARVEEREDGLLVPGGQTLHGAEIESHGDHRIAMAFAIAALRAEGETIIHGAEAARISYPEFFEALEKITQR